jgi:2-oxoglutarate dehydrogenase E1 component
MTLISCATCRKIPKILFLPTKSGVTSFAQVSVAPAWFLTDPQHIYVAVGQVYHALLQEREAKGIKDIAISRVEQISPFPYDLVCPPLTSIGT